MPRALLARSVGELSVVLALVFLLPATGWARTGPVNLLSNPGFEEGLPGHPWMPARWDTSRAGVQTVFFGRDSFMVHSGTFAVSAASVSSVMPMAHNWSQGMPVPKAWWGKDAVFSIWTRSLGVSGRGYALLQAFRDTISQVAFASGVSRDSAQHVMDIKSINDPILDLGWQRQYFSEEETEWVRREVRVYLPPLTNALFVRGGLIGTGQILFDDASLSIEAAKPPAPLPLRTNLLRDPGFESGANAWEYSLPPYPTLRAVIDTTVAHSGRASVMVTGGEQGWVVARAGICQVLSNRGLAGKRVRLSGYLKTDSLRSMAYVKIYAHSLHGAEQSSASPAISMNTDWTLVTAEMDVPADAYEVWAWFAYNAPAPEPGRVYFDDTSFEVLGPASPPGRGQSKR